MCVCMSVCHHEDLDVFARMVSVGFNEIWSARSEESHSKGMASFWKPFQNVFVWENCSYKSCINSYLIMTRGFGGVR